MRSLENCYDRTNLDDLKQARVEEIDMRTQAIIYDGFTYDSDIFSMSITAQINWSNLLNVPDEMFPLTVSTKSNGTKSLALTDKNPFYMTALNHKNSAIQSGTVLKQQILNASTIEDVNNIIDNR